MSSPTAGGEEKAHRRAGMSLEGAAERQPRDGATSDDDQPGTRAPLVRSQRMSAPPRLRRRDFPPMSPHSSQDSDTPPPSDLQHSLLEADQTDKASDDLWPDAEIVIQVASPSPEPDEEEMIPEVTVEDAIAEEERRWPKVEEIEAMSEQESGEPCEDPEVKNAEESGSAAACEENELGLPRAAEGPLEAEQWAPPSLEPGASRAHARLYSSSTDDEEDEELEGAVGEARQCWSPGEVNLGFEDTEPDLRYIDISQPDCDHLPWYFGGRSPEGPRSQRPHSIAVPGEQSFLDRSDPLRATAPHRQTFSERPQSTTGAQLASRRPSIGEIAVIHSSASSLGSGDIDWSWVSGEEERQRRASMRRMEPLPPLAAHLQLQLQLQQRACRASAPPASPLQPHITPAVDFPRRYSASAVGRRVQSIIHRHNSSSSSSTSSDSTDDGPQHASDSDRARSGRRGAEDAGAGPGRWPHALSGMFAMLSCTLGLFNISRFAILSIQFGANFILQFIFLSLVLGIPLLTVQASLGQYLNAGVMDMWKISPVFQGIGIALLASQALIGVYSIVGVSWMFIYFRDSFITKQDQYPWAVFEQYREELQPQINGSHKLEETVPDYLNGMVLQRQSLIAPDPAFGHLKFQVTFNLAVVWMIVFVSLSKGLKSYGKVIYVFSLFSVLGMLILCTKILGLTNSASGHQVFPETVWSEFFINTKCWVAATTEVFYTWGLLGAAVMQITSHNQHKHFLNRDISIVIVITLANLLLSAFLANTCVQLLAGSGYKYIPSSFERLSTVTFLQSEDTPHPVYARTPVRYMPHSLFILGSRVLLPGMDLGKESGYQVLRLATELAPSTFALLGSEQVSPFWAVLFYFVLITFGIAQQLAIWHCVITGITAIKSSSLKSWETTITFFSCACGFVLGLPMTTELGIFVVYFMDFVVGSGWWIMVLYLLQISAVFVIRGRPYSGERVVAALFAKNAGCLEVWAGPMLVFTWNVILPVALMVLCITVFKNGRFRELYIWHNTGHDYWPLWVREIGSLLQILPLLAVPLVAVIQSCRYLSGGPPDLFDRLRLLYRPPIDIDDADENDVTANNAANTTSTTNVISSPVHEPTFEDPPPKYTPPPSYTTATGARIAKLLRQSFRRSVRRITQALGDSGNTSESSAGPRSLSAAVTASSSNSQAPPPDYAAVLVEMNCPMSTESYINHQQSTMTAAEVANVLRSSVRRPFYRSHHDNVDMSKEEQHSTSLI